MFFLPRASRSTRRNLVVVILFVVVVVVVVLLLVVVVLGVGKARSVSKELVRISIKKMLRSTVFCEQFRMCMHSFNACFVCIQEPWAAKK